MVSVETQPKFNNDPSPIIIQSACPWRLRNGTGWSLIASPSIGESDVESGYGQIRVARELTQLLEGGRGFHSGLGRRLALHHLALV